MGTAAALSLAAAPPASAVIITVGADKYDITTFTGSYNNDTSMFQTFSNDGVMPWWGDSTLAKDFAKQLGDKLGFPVADVYGPFFAYDNSFALFSAFYESFSGNVISEGFGASQTLTFAQATLVPPSQQVPGPLPLFGVAAAFGISRRLRHRIRKSL